MARALVGLRILCIADGPNVVHKQPLALMEIKKAKQHTQARTQITVLQNITFDFPKSNSHVY